MTKTTDSESAAESIVTMDRRRDDRRANDDQPSSEDQPTRRKVQRRRQIDPTTCERDYSGDEIEFMQAMDAYKRAAGRMFPTCSEILEVIRDLGYVRLTEDQKLELFGEPVEEDEVIAEANDTEDEDADLEAAEA